MSKSAKKRKRIIAAREIVIKEKKIPQPNMKEIQGNHVRWADGKYPPTKQTPKKERTALSVYELSWGTGNKKRKKKAYNDSKLKLDRVERVLMKESGDMKPKRSKKRIRLDALLAYFTFHNAGGVHQKLIKQLADARKEVKSKHSRKRAMKFKTKSKLYGYRKPEA